MRKLPFTNPSLWLIPAALLLVFFPLVIGQEVLKWDVMDQFFPCRIFISESLANGEFPWWNPYINLGYPFAADPQSGAFYPIVWLFSLFGKYSVYTITAEWLLTFLIAGFGMRRLLKEAEIDDASASLFAIAYMLSGAFISNAQHLTWLISMAWIPWACAGFWQILKGKAKAVTLLGTGIVCSFALTGGYPAFSVILNYTLFFIFILWLLAAWRQRKLKEIKKTSIQLVLTYGIFLLVSLPFLVSFFEAKPLISRSSLSLKEVYENALPLKALITLIFPWAGGSLNHNWGADISMIGLYAGFFTLPLAAYAMKRQRDKINWLLFFTGLIMLCAALGPATPIRAAFYYAFPFMDMFRNGSLFRFFFLICLIIIAARGFYFWRGTGASDQLLNRLVTLFAILGLALGMYGGIKDPGGFMEFGLGRSKIDHFNKSAGIWAHIAWQGIFSAIFVWLPLWWASRKGYQARGFFATILVIDLFIAVFVLRPATVSYPRSAADLQKALNERVEAVEPALSNPSLSSVSHISGGGIDPIWYNSNMFSHRIAHDGFNNFHLQAYAELKAGPDKFKLATNHLVRWANGSVEAIEITSFSGNQIEIKTAFNRPGPLVLSQLYYPGWEVLVDGEKAELKSNELGLMTVHIKEGDHLVQFKYHAGWRMWLLWVSVFALIGSTVLLLLKMFYHREPLDLP